MERVKAISNADLRKQRKKEWKKQRRESDKPDFTSIKIRNVTTKTLVKLRDGCCIPHYPVYPGQRYLVTAMLKKPENFDRYAFFRNMKYKCANHKGTCILYGKARYFECDEWSDWEDLAYDEPIPLEEDNIKFELRFTDPNKCKSLKALHLSEQMCLYFSVTS